MFAGWIQTAFPKTSFTDSLRQALDQLVVHIYVSRMPASVTSKPATSEWTHGKTLLTTEVSGGKQSKEAVRGPRRRERDSLARREKGGELRRVWLLVSRPPMFLFALNVLNNAVLGSAFLAMNGSAAPPDPLPARQKEAIIIFRGINTGCPRRCSLTSGTLKYMKTKRQLYLV